MSNGRVAVPGGRFDTFKPESSTNSVTSHLEKLYGVGDLVDAEGVSVVVDKLCAGSYVYAVSVPAPAPASVPVSHDHKVLSLLQSFWSACRGRMPDDVIGYVSVKEWYALNSEHSINVPLRKGLLVRKCFKHFLQVCLEDLGADTYVHVNGPSGIGKSAFLWYVVMMVGAVTGTEAGARAGAGAGLDLNFDVIVQLVVENNPTATWVGFFRDGSVGYSRFDYGDLKHRCSGRVLHLVDQKYQGDHLGYVMVFGSPDEENTKIIDKTGGARVVTKVLPTWKEERDEFYQLMEEELNLDRDAVDKIVLKWGYVPRVVFKYKTAEQRDESERIHWQGGLVLCTFIRGDEVSSSVPYNTLQAFLNGSRSCVVQDIHDSFCQRLSCRSLS